MNLARAKRTLILALSVVLVLGLVPATAFAAKPYFKSFGGDVFTGGWFDDGAGACLTEPSSNFQDPFYNPPSNPLLPSNATGGIRTYAKENAGNSAGGASVEFAAFALGVIDGARADDGFYSSGALSPTTKQRLSFANNNSSSAPWGGLFQGTNRQQSHCIADYFGTKKPASLSPTSGNVPSSSFNTDGSYFYNNSPTTTITSGNITIQRGKKVTIYVDGNAYIGGNIEYQNNIQVDNVTKFALVVRGSIYIDPGVTRLDGLYIAQPINNNSASVTADEGVIWTCHPNNTSQILDDYPVAQCGSRLVVNGAFIAKQINLLRTPGDLTGATTAEDTTCANAVAGRNFNGNGPSSVNGTCANIAEVFNYPPEMVVGGPFFNPLPSASLKVQSLVSLPPVF